MTDVNTIISNLKRFHYKTWEGDKLEECKKLLAGMSKDELRTIMHSKWMNKGNALYPTLFELFFKDELKNVDEDMAHMPQCVKVERITVLNNLLSVLGHLNDLKK